MQLRANHSGQSADLHPNGTLGQSIHVSGRVDPLCQAHILQYILRHREHGTSLTAIHRDFGYSMATLSGMLKRLREKGYIRTETCAVDDRRKLLYPTEKGVQVQEFLDDTIRAIEGEMYSCFSPEELATLDCLQKKMLHHLADLIQQRQKEAIKT